METEPNTSTKTPRITRLSADTLYWGECVSLFGSGFGSNAYRLRLFSGSIPIPAILISDSELKICIPTNLESGKLRLYHDDDLAKGNLDIHIIQKEFSSIQWGVSWVTPILVYEDEQFEIRGSGFPLRGRDLAARIGDHPCIIDSFTETSIYARVPFGAKTDSIIVNIMGKSKYMGTMSILSHDDDLLKPVIVQNIYAEWHLDARYLWRNIYDSGDTISEILTHTMQLSIPFSDDEKTKVQHKGDSILYEGSVTYADGSRATCEIRLLQHKPTSTVSGLIRISKSEFPGSYVNRQFAEFRVEGLQFKRTSASQSILEVKGKIADNIIKHYAWRYEYDEGDRLNKQETIEYLPSSTSQAWFKVIFYQ